MPRTGKIEHRQFRKSDPGNEAGQALVEVALTLPLLLILLLGSVELGRMEYAGIELTNAARAGVQYGAQGPFYSGDTPGITTAAQNEANDIYSLNTTGFTVSSSLANSCSDGSTLSGTPPACTGTYGVVEQNLTVTAQTTFDPLIYLPGMAHTITVQGRATQKVLIQ